jgi:hypothetical protein
MCVQIVDVRDGETEKKLKNNAHITAQTLQIEQMSL